MRLLHYLRASWAFSALSAGVALLTTLLTVRYAGAPAFATFAIDLAKVSLLVLVFEAVPSPYALFAAQDDATFKNDLASYALLAPAIALVGFAAMAVVGILTHVSPWAALYVVYVGLQRYLDVKLQSEGRLSEFFQLTFVSNCGRLLLLTCAWLFNPAVVKLELLWAALSLGSIASLVLWFARRPREFQPFTRRNHVASLSRLLHRRPSYYPYYLNVGLKRLRDSSMPILCGIVVMDKVEVARYLLAYRGLDFVLGQLRVAEAVLTNIANRLALRENRRGQFLLLAVLGQLAALCASVFLGAQAGLDEKTLLTAGIASFFVYPYVAELVRRSDAYASVKPLRVTVSLSVYLVALVVVISLLWRLEALSSWCLVLAPVIAQAAAALSYWFVPRPAT